MVSRMDLFIPKGTLDILSYKSTLGRSLKQISLRETPLQNILEDIERYHASYIDVLIQENLIGSRFKSEGKLLYKEYAAKIICCEQDFIERLKYWEGELNGR